MVLASRSPEVCQKVSFVVYTVITFGANSLYFFLVAGIAAADVGRQSGSAAVVVGLAITVIINAVGAIGRTAVQRPGNYAAARTNRCAYEY